MLTVRSLTFTQLRRCGTLGVGVLAENDQAEFGALLRLWRKRRGMTQRTLADRMSYHPSRVSQVESGALPHEEFARQADSVLGAGGELWALFERVAPSPFDPPPAGPERELVTEDFVAWLADNSGDGLRRPLRLGVRRRDAGWRASATQCATAVTCTAPQRRPGRHRRRPGRLLRRRPALPGSGRRHRCPHGGRHPARVAHVAGRPAQRRRAGALRPAGLPLPCPASTPASWRPPSPAWPASRSTAR